MSKDVVRIKVDLSPRSYEILIQSGLLAQAGNHLRQIVGNGKSLFVVTVPPVLRRWGKKLIASLRKSGFPATILEMPDGERHKRLATVEDLAQQLTKLGADRNAVILAFGGGVVGDVAGMLASIYMRGIDVIQIPTTVLAQVDASIGGKTGVNLRTGKNLIGTFHQPRLVLIDPELLTTLPAREFRAGLYESLKCGVIGIPELFEKLERTTVASLRNDPASLQWVIAESVKLKAEVVAKDEREGGLRRILNFGHTIGHGLEAQSNYKRFLHGEAVAWGMLAATHIAVGTNRLDARSANRIIRAVLNLGPLPKVTAGNRAILRLVQTDKKTAGGRVHFILPTAIGKVDIVNDVPSSLIAESMARLRQLSARSFLRSQGLNSPRAKKRC